MPKAQALREAQTWLRQLTSGGRNRLAAQLGQGEMRGTVVLDKPEARPGDKSLDRPYEHPRYWSTFILLGDPE